MGFPIKRQEGTPHAHVVRYDPSNMDFPPRKDAKALAEVVFHLRAITVRANKAINDLMVVSDANGKQTMRSGTYAFERVRRSIARVEGFDSDSGPVTVLTAEQLEELPVWMFNDVLGAINELAKEEEDEEKN